MSNDYSPSPYADVAHQPAKPPVRQRRLSQSVAQSLPVAGGMLGSLLMSLPAMAQLPIEEIIVTDTQRGGYVQESSSLSHFSERLLDTPQSITTLTDGMLQDRGVMDLDDALRNVPGITLGAGEFNWQGNNPTIRGFSSRNDMYVDGLRDLGGYFRDPFNLERIEIVQGPSSTMFGRGSTGGIINQSSKTPQQESIRRINLNLGNADTRRFTADFNEALDWTENAAFRLNLLHHDSEVPKRDGAKAERFAVAPSLSLDLGSATRLTLSHMHMQSDNRPDYGLPWVEGRPAEVDRSNYYGFKDDYLDTEVDISSARLNHAFNDNVRLDAQIRYADYARESRITEPQVAPSVSRDTPPEQVTVNRFIFSGESTERMLQGQVSLHSDFTTGPVSHSLITGVEFSNETSAPAYGFAGITPYVDYDVPVPDTNLAHPGGSFDGATLTRLRASTNSDTLAAYATNTMKFNNGLQWVVGLRWDHFDTNYIERRFDEHGAQTGSAQFIQKDIETSYRTALVYKPAENGSVYLGWGTSFNPSGEGVSFVTSGRNLATSNVSLEPEENESVEFGTKWELLGERLFVDAAIFRITKKNARVSDPERPGYNMLAGEQEVDGLTVNMVGRLTNTLQISAGYAWLDSEQKASAHSSLTEGAQLTNVAEHTGNIWLNWTPMVGLELGAGANYVDERLATNSGLVKKVPDYWTADLMGKYSVNETVTLKLNLTNVDNEYYMDQIHPWHVIPGAGFGAVFAINLDF